MTSTMDQILDSAISVFAHSGYKNSTIKEIAKKANVNSLTVFRYFTDKKMLFLAAVDRMKTTGFDPKAVNQRFTYSDVEADLMEMSKAYLNAICDNLPLIRVYIGDGFNFDELKEDAWFVMPALKEHFLSYLEKVAGAAPLARAHGELLAEMFVSYITRKVMASNKYQKIWTPTPKFTADFVEAMKPQAKCMARMITGCQA